MLIELAEVNPQAAANPESANAAFTIRWQSSNDPATSRAATLPPKVVSCFSCNGLTRPAG